MQTRKYFNFWYLQKVKNFLYYEHKQEVNNMNKDFRYFERPHYQDPVEEPKQQFSAPMLVVKNNELVVEQKV